MCLLYIHVTLEEFAVLLSKKLDETLMEKTCQFFIHEYYINLVDRFSVKF